jgi:hypothetical protein
MRREFAEYLWKPVVFKVFLSVPGQHVTARNTLKTITFQSYSCIPKGSQECLEIPSNSLQTLSFLGILVNTQVGSGDASTPQTQSPMSR